MSAFKPVVTGLDERAGRVADGPRAAGASATGQAPGDVAPYTFGPAVSPHWAAELAGRPIEPERLLAVARAAPGFVVCEGVGGLLVPLTPGYSVRDLAVDLGLPLVVAARTGLGTINHTLLTVEAARAAGLEVAGIVMTPWPEQPGADRGRPTARRVERLAGVPVSGLPPTTPGRARRRGRRRYPSTIGALRPDG